MVCAVATGSPLASLMQGNTAAPVAATTCADDFSHAVNVAFARPAAPSGAALPQLALPPPPSEPTAIASTESEKPGEAFAPASATLSRAIADSESRLGGSPAAAADALPSPSASATARPDQPGTDIRDPVGSTVVAAPAPVPSPAADAKPAVDSAPVPPAAVETPQRDRESEQAPAVDPTTAVQLDGPAPSIAVAGPAPAPGDTPAHHVTLPGVLAAQAVAAPAVSPTAPNAAAQQPATTRSHPVAPPEIAVPLALMPAPTLASGSTKPALYQAGPQPTPAVSPQTVGTAVGLATDFTPVENAVGEGKGVASAARDPIARTSKKLPIEAQPDERGVAPAPLDLPPATAMMNAAAMVVPQPAATPQNRSDAKRGTVGTSAPIQSPLATTATDGRYVASAEPLPQDRFSILSSDNVATPTEMLNSGPVPAERTAPGATVSLLSVPVSAPSAPMAAAQSVTVPVAAAAYAEPVVTARPGQIGHELGVEIARRVSAGGDELLVRLVPAELGRIEVRMSFDERGGLRAVIAADSPVALDMLRRDSADLSRSLSDAGVRSDAQSLRFQSDNGSGSNNGQPRNPWLDSDTRAGRGARDSSFAEDSERIPYRQVRTSGRYDLLA